VKSDPIPSKDPSLNERRANDSAIMRRSLSVSDSTVRGFEVLYSLSLLLGS